MTISSDLSDVVNNCPARPSFCASLSELQAGVPQISAINKHVTALPILTNKHSTLDTRPRPCLNWSSAHSNPIFFLLPSEIQYCAFIALQHLSHDKHNLRSPTHPHLTRLYRNHTRCLAEAVEDAVVDAVDSARPHASTRARCPSTLTRSSRGSSRSRRRTQITSFR